MNEQFKEIHDTVSGKVVMRNWHIDWQEDVSIFNRLHLYNKTGAEAYDEAKYFGAPVDRKWWQFWVPKVTVSNV